MCENFNVAYGATVMEHSVELGAIICGCLSQRTFVTIYSQCDSKALIVHCVSVSESFSSRRRRPAGRVTPFVYLLRNSDPGRYSLFRLRSCRRNSGNI
jgi:hypothetical protein